MTWLYMYEFIHMLSIIPFVEMPCLCSSWLILYFFQLFFKNWQTNGKLKILLSGTCELLLTLHVWQIEIWVIINHGLDLFGVIICFRFMLISNCVGYNCCSVTLEAIYSYQLFNIDILWFCINYILSYSRTLFDFYTCLVLFYLICLLLCCSVQRNYCAFTSFLLN